MSSVDGDSLQIIQPEETNPTSSRKSILSYTREFLLSLSDSEICKRLPEGFDESLLSEFGGLPKQALRLNEALRLNDYSSSPPGKGETDNFSRGVHRWDNRASGRSDADSQSDRDSDSGRRYGNQIRRSWQNPEHDGLLGSGSIPRQPGNRPGAPVSSFRANDQQHLLSKSSDPYHPPRLYKAVPHSRRETKDSLNDETFGSAEGTSEDRSEEERKRRAEFEMMRKEQHKELQEKMKSKAKDKLKVDPLIDLAASLDSEGDAVVTEGLDTSLMKPILQHDFGKSNISSQGHSFRPLVPPGFASAAVEKVSGPMSVEHPVALEVGKLEVGHGSKDEKPAPKLGMDENHFEITSLLTSKVGAKVHLASEFELFGKATDANDQSFRAPNTSDISGFFQNANMGIVSENLVGHKMVGETGRSTKIFETFFGDPLSTNNSAPPDIIEEQNKKTDDVWSSKGLNTSKFAHLFPEDEYKFPESGSLESSNDLLSLIVGASETKPIQKILPLESNLMKVATSVPNDSGISEVFSNNQTKPETFSAFLTCEDLEQSILSNVGGSNSHSQPPGVLCSEQGMDNEIRKTDIDKNASHHLLSLLQRGNSSNTNTMPPISMVDKGFPTEFQDLDSDSKKRSNIQDNIRAESADLNSGKGLTLETLFGTAFMKELNAPVSERNSVISSMDVSESSMPPLVISDDGAQVYSVNDARYRRGYQTNSDEKVGVNWLNDFSQAEPESSNSPSFGTRLPEEDGLTSYGLPVKKRGSVYMNDLGVTDAEIWPPSSNPSVNIAEKLAALGVSVRDERPAAHRQDNSPFLRGPFERAKPEIPHPSMHVQSSPQVNTAPVNLGRQMFHHLDPHAAHIDSQYNFMPLEGMPRQDAPIHHQFPANLGHAPYRHPSTGSDFDPSHPMLQQMRMQNNYPPSHISPGFPRGAPPPHFGGNPGYIQQEHNQIQGLPSGQRQPNLGGPRMPLPGPEHGVMNNHQPQALQRLHEMDVRSSQKPMQHPSFGAGSGHSRPVYGHETDAGFWYR